VGLSKIAELLTNKNALNIGISLTCLEIRQEMRRWLILDETGFTHQRFFTSHLIDGRVFFRIFTFYIIFDNLFLN